MFNSVNVFFPLFHIVLAEPSLYWFLEGNESRINWLAFSFYTCIRSRFESSYMSVHLGVSVDLSIYDVFLGVFALLLLLLLYIARQPATEVGIGEIAQPCERLEDTHDPPVTVGQTAPCEPGIRLTYGQSTRVRDRARALFREDAASANRTGSDGSGPGTSRHS